jgi:hypothetical protein
MIGFQQTELFAQRRGIELTVGLIAMPDILRRLIAVYGNHETC